jgi:hypothetical protein
LVKPLAIDFLKYKILSQIVYKYDKLRVMSEENKHYMLKFTVEDVRHLLKGYERLNLNR